MLVLIKSSPETAEAERALKLARDMSAGIVLFQNGVYLVEKNRLDGFSGVVHVIEEDVRMRGLAPAGGKTRAIGYHDLVDIMADAGKVIGVF